MNTPPNHPTPTPNGPHTTAQDALSGPHTPDTGPGPELLDRVEAALRRYVRLPSEHALVGVVLWIAATHAQPAWAHAPRLVIRAPEKRCGKSRLLDVVEALCWNPFITVNASPAAVYRSVTEDPPSLLVDEADTIFGPKADANEDLRGLLNAGHQRNRPAKRYDAASNQVQSIPTFAMAALAGIGLMPDTIEDRAVIVRMRRRAPGETVAPFRYRRDRGALQELAGELNAWLRADLPAVEAIQPVMPVEDRVADNWEPLFAVAIHAGGHWPARAHAAVLALEAETSESIAAQASHGIRLLTDIHTAFADLSKIPTRLLLERLLADAEAPWREYGKNGHGLTNRALSELLAEYGIGSATIRFDEGQAKGYHRTAFTDAWSRYTPNLLPDTEADTDTGLSEGEGVAVPAVPAVASQVRGGTAQHPGTARAVPSPTPGTARAVPDQPAVPGLTCDATAGTAGTAPPPPPRALRAIR